MDDARRSPASGALASYYGYCRCGACGSALSARTLEGGESSANCPRPPVVLSATPRNTEDRTFQLLGYRWVDVPLADRQRAAAQLLAEQRRDGGWGQLPNLASDAYATGEALDALYQAGDIDVQAPAYQRGLRFLLSSQRPDSYWLVQHD